MALSKKDLQRKRENKKKKRQAKSSITLTSNSYNDWPIYECWVPIDLSKIGMGQVVVARHNNNQNKIAVGVYLIDMCCLGIKNCFTRIVEFANYKDMLEGIIHSGGELKQVEPSYAKTIIYQAAEYAKQHGFPPHKDFAKAKNMLKNIPIDDNQTLVFGHNSKPCYIQGPHESPADIRRIVTTLESTSDPANVLIENESN